MHSFFFLQIFIFSRGDTIGIYYSSRGFSISRVRKSAETGRPKTGFIFFFFRMTDRTKRRTAV